MQVHFHLIKGNDFHQRLLYCGRIINKAMAARMHTDILIAQQYHSQLSDTLWQSTPDAFIPSGEKGVVRFITSIDQIESSVVINFTLDYIQSEKVKKLFMVVGHNEESRNEHRPLYKQYQDTGFKPEFLEI